MSGIQQLKCKSCGGTLSYNGSSVIKCSYCDTINLINGISMAMPVTSNRVRKPFVTICRINGEASTVIVSSTTKTVRTEELINGLLCDTIEFDMLSRVKLAKYANIDLEILAEAFKLKDMNDNNLNSWVETYESKSVMDFYIDLQNK